MVPGLAVDFRGAPLVPELLVSNLKRSVAFWCGHIAQIMREQRDEASRNWLTGPLDPPLGRGINFQIEVGDLQGILGSLTVAAWPLFMGIEEKWYRVSDHERGQRQFLVQDPDGYLLRLATPLGVRQIGTAEA